jgi:hypothetical protein
MKDNAQIHALAALSSEKQPRLYIGSEAECLQSRFLRGG